MIFFFTWAYFSVFPVDSLEILNPIHEIHKIKSILLIMLMCYFPFYSSWFLSVYWSFSEANRRIQPFSTVRHYRNFIKGKTVPMELNLPKMNKFESGFITRSCDKEHSLVATTTLVMSLWNLIQRTSWATWHWDFQPTEIKKYYTEVILSHNF